MELGVLKMTSSSKKCGRFLSRPLFKRWVGFTHSIPQNEDLGPCSCAHAACGTRPLFWKLCCRCLGKHSQTETSFKTNFLLMKGENSITSYCIVLMFKLAEIRWLFKEILVFWSIGYRLFMDDVITSIKLMTWTMDGCLVLNKLVRKRLKLCSRVMITPMLTVEMWAFLLGFSFPAPTLRLIAPILLWLGEATHSKLLGTKRVKNDFMTSFTTIKITTFNATVAARPFLSAAS